MGAGLFEDEPRQRLGGRIGIEGHERLPQAGELRDDRVVPVQEELMVPRGVDPGVEFLFDLVEVNYHAALVERGAGELNLRHGVVAVQVAAFSFVAEEAVSVAEMDDLGDLEHGMIL